MQDHRTTDPRSGAEDRARAEAWQLFALTEGLVRARSLEDVFDPALDALLHLLGVTGASIRLFDEDGVLQFQATRGLYDSRRAVVGRLTPWRPDARRAEPVFVADALADPSLGPLAPLLDRERIRSLAHFPLLEGAHVIGELLTFDERPRMPGPDELRVSGTVAALVAQGVVRLRLLESERVARAQAEAALNNERRALAAAREADRRKDEFLAMLGHELRNPLAPISTALHLIRLKVGSGERPAMEGSPPERVRIDREVALIDRQVTHLTRLVDDLLDLSRVTRGKVQLAREPVEIATVLGKAIDLAGPLLEQRRHRLVLDVAHRVTLEADPVRLAQVFANLLTNAAKYTNPGGRIEISTAPHEGDDVVEVTIRDNGIGIPPELLPHVFERFVQGMQSPDRTQGGLGIGLALVKSLTELHGGSVSGHSEGPGRGSTFRVRLPTIPSSAAGTARRERTPVLRTCRPLRVLVVDDLADVRDPLAELLSRCGHEVATAPDGPTALQVAATLRPEAAIVDIGLPVMDGCELGSRLRDLFPSLLLIAVTGYGLDTDRAKTRQAGFEAHFVKPVAPTDLLHALEDFAESGAANRHR